MSVTNIEKVQGRTWGQAVDSTAHGKWKSEPRILEAALLTDLGGGRIGRGFVERSSGLGYGQGPLSAAGGLVGRTGERREAGCLV